MILKSYEINKINLNINKIILLYGRNDGLKSETINTLIKKESDLEVLKRRRSRY